MALKLSLRTQKIIERLFSPSEQATISKLLIDECGNNLPFCKDSDEHGMERIRFAALKVSSGDALKLSEAVELAKTDWRDLLLWAEYGSDLEAHEHWARGILDGHV